MCLGIPGQVVSRVDGYGDQLIEVEVEGALRRVNIGMLDEPLPTAGDWVLIHMGFAVERVDEAGAREAMEGLEMVGRARADAPPALEMPPPPPGWEERRA